MSKKASTKGSLKNFPGYEFVKQAGGIEEYRLKSNNLTVLFQNRKDTGIVTTNITYRVGAKDEHRGITGVAHMLEHMLFKPTTFDKKNKMSDSASMLFERETGCILNANTWKDRTTYYFSYPQEYFAHALQIEAERMTGTILTDKELAPEQNNVLSEFDMYNGDPHYALHVQVCSTAFHSHPYGHETLGYREDIEDYTAEKLEVFYRNYYRPDNATMMVIGDVDKETALKEVKKQFGSIQNPVTPIPRLNIREPKQEGLRRANIERTSTSSLLSIGFKHAGFPTKEWFITSTMLDILTSGPESILQKKLIDTGLASSVGAMIEPTYETNVGVVNVDMENTQSLDKIEKIVLDTVRSLTAKDIQSLIEKTKEQNITEELFAREKSMRVAADLTEYVAADSWDTYAKALDIIKKVSTKDVLNCLETSFKENNLTIGHFKGTN